MKRGLRFQILPENERHKTCRHDHRKFQPPDLADVHGSGNRRARFLPCQLLAQRFEIVSGLGRRGRFGRGQKINFFKLFDGV